MFSMNRRKPFASFASSAVTSKTAFLPFSAVDGDHRAYGCACLNWSVRAFVIKVVAERNTFKRLGIHFVENIQVVGQNRAHRIIAAG